MGKRQLKFWLLVDWHTKNVRVLKKQPRQRGPEIPIEVNLTLTVPDEQIVLNAEVDLTERSIANVFLKDISEGFKDE